MSVFSETLNKILSDEQIIIILFFIASQKGIRFSSYRYVNILLFTGIKVRVYSPYFYYEREKKSGRKKKGRKKGNNLDCHLCLSLMGFVELYSPYIVQEIALTSLSCPSFSVASEVLKGRAINLCVSTIEKICINMAKVGMESRGKISLSGTENLSGLTLVVGVEGGRLRIRKTKRGKKKKGAKQQGYYTDWREA